MNCLLPFLIVLHSGGMPPVEPDPDSVGRRLAVTVDQRLYPAPVPQHQPANPAMPHESSGSQRVIRGVLGGAIGAVAGVVTCTLISNAFFNEGGSGMSTCTTSGNVTFAVVGFTAGFAIGWFTGGDNAQR